MSKRFWRDVRCQGAQLHGRRRFDCVRPLQESTVSLRSARCRLLDLRVILEIPLRQVVPWLAAVLLVSWAGYPGVVCVTPMAWLIALRAGLLCVMRSRSESSAHRLLEAGLAGAFFGLMQGILFMVIVPFMGPIKVSEQGNAILLTVIMLIGGILAGAVLSLFTAFLREQRRKREATPPVVE